MRSEPYQFRAVAARAKPGAPTLALMLERPLLLDRLLMDPWAN